MFYRLSARYKLKTFQLLRYPLLFILARLLCSSPVQGASAYRGPQDEYHYWSQMSYLKSASIKHPQFGSYVHDACMTQDGNKIYFTRSGNPSPSIYVLDTMTYKIYPIAEGLKHTVRSLIMSQNDKTIFFGYDNQVGLLSAVDGLQSDQKKNMKPNHQQSAWQSPVYMTTYNAPGSSSKNKIRLMAMTQNGDMLFTTDSQQQTHGSAFVVNVWTFSKSTKSKSKSLELDSTVSLGQEAPTCLLIYEPSAHDVILFVGTAGNQIYQKVVLQSKPKELDQIEEDEEVIIKGHLNQAEQSQKAVVLNINQHVFDGDNNQKRRLTSLAVDRKRKRLYFGGYSKKGGFVGYTSIAGRGLQPNGDIFVRLSSLLINKITLSERGSLLFGGSCYGSIVLFKVSEINQLKENDEEEENEEPFIFPTKFPPNQFPQHILHKLLLHDGRIYALFYDGTLEIYHVPYHKKVGRWVPKASIKIAEPIFCIEQNSQGVLYLGAARKVHIVTSSIDQENDKFMPHHQANLELSDTVGAMVLSEDQRYLYIANGSHISVVKLDNQGKKFDNQYKFSKPCKGRISSIVVHRYHHENVIFSSSFRGELLICFPDRLLPKKSLSLNKSELSFPIYQNVIDGHEDDEKEMVEVPKINEAKKKKQDDSEDQNNLLYYLFNFNKKGNKNYIDCPIHALAGYQSHVLNRLYTGSRKGDLVIWDVSINHAADQGTPLQLEQCAKFPALHGEAISSIIITHNGYILTGGIDGKIVVLQNQRAGAIQLASFTHQASIQVLSFTLYDEYALVGIKKYVHALLLRSMVSPDTVTQPLSKLEKLRAMKKKIQENNNLSQVNVSYSITDDSILLSNDKIKINSMRVSSIDGESLWIGTQRRGCILLKKSTSQDEGIPIPPIKKENLGNNSFTLSSTLDYTNFTKKKPLTSKKKQTNVFTAITFSSKNIYTGDSNGQILIWSRYLPDTDGTNEKPKPSLVISASEDKNSRVTHLAYVEDSRVLISLTKGNKKRTVRIWDDPSNQEAYLTLPPLFLNEKGELSTQMPKNNKKKANKTKEIGGPYHIKSDSKGTVLVGFYPENAVVIWELKRSNYNKILHKVSLMRCFRVKHTMKYLYIDKKSKTPSIYGIDSKDYFFKFPCTYKEDDNNYKVQRVHMKNIHTSCVVFNPRNQTLYATARKGSNILYWKNPDQVKNFEQEATRIQIRVNKKNLNNIPFTILASTYTNELLGSILSMTTDPMKESAIFFILDPSSGLNINVKERKLGYIELNDQGFIEKNRDDVLIGLGFDSDDEDKEKKKKTPLDKVKAYIIDDGLLDSATGIHVNHGNVGVIQDNTVQVWQAKDLNNHDHSGIIV
ncbi:MAG: hypothetical protein AAF770_01550 [Bacteroidota bacterium]